MPRCEIKDIAGGAKVSIRTEDVLIVETLTKVGNSTTITQYYVQLLFRQGAKWAINFKTQASADAAYNEITSLMDNET